MPGKESRCVCRSLSERQHEAPLEISFASDGSGMLWEGRGTLYSTRDGWPTLALASPRAEPNLAAAPASKTSSTTSTGRCGSWASCSRRAERRQRSPAVRHRGRRTRPQRPLHLRLRPQVEALPRRLTSSQDRTRTERLAGDGASASRARRSEPLPRALACLTRRNEDPRRRHSRTARNGRRYPDV
jgi:hypothetical protein